MKIEEQIKYWINSADSDLQVSERLFINEDYHWCLFIGHLVLEKILKAHFIRDNKKLPPKTHDLIKLAKHTGLPISEELVLLFSVVNDFNIESRYPEVKMNFYKKCTKEFTAEYFSKIKEAYKWLKSRLK